MNVGTRHTIGKYDMKTNRLSSLLLHRRTLLLAALLLAAGTGFAVDKKGELNRRSEHPQVQINVDSTPVDRNGGLRTSFSDVIEQAAPSVVKVFTSTEVKLSQSPFGPGMDDPFLRRFFGPRMQVPGRRQQAPPQTGLGSGVIISADGYILTNNHVVENADEVRIALYDEREFKAEVVGTDPKTDLAVLKIKADDLPYATVADSDNIKVGDVVLALGNPFGIGQTVTMGIISATGRSTLGLDYEDFIQTDAAINPGNSGGALMDADGRLIGINTAILSRSGGNNGIGFAVPTNLARNVMESLIENGRVVRGFMGVAIQDVDQDLAKAFGLISSQGALVSQVTEDSPAEKAGLRSGDIITKFNGKNVAGSRQLKLMVSQTLPNRDVPVELVRDGAAETLAITLGELPGDRMMSDAGKTHDSSTDVLDGVMVDDVDPTTRRRLNIPDQIGGAVVLRVDPASPSYRSGLREGDVIMEIDRKHVSNARDAVELSEDVGNEVLLKIWSRGGTRYLVVSDSTLG